MTIYPQQMGKGNTKYLRIPKAVAELLNISTNSPFNVEVVQGRLIFTQQPQVKK